MLIKICGITSEEEIEFLNLLKPDYIGFVFAESKRKITLEKAMNLVLNVNPSIKIIGVFKDNPIEEVYNISSILPIHGIQLHGNEDLTYIKELIPLKKEIWKALSYKEGMNIKDRYPLADKFLFDGVEAGSGQVFDWSIIDSNNEFILAGGLSIENIDEALKVKGLIGVDVSSGVEIVDKKGNRKKDYRKVKEFIERVRLNEKGKR